MDITIKQTSLSSSTDVVNTLQWKLEAINEKGGNPQTELADYVYLAVQELKAQLAQFKPIEDEIKQRKSYLKAQLESVEEGAAVFLEDMGLDKLEGNIISSVTIQLGKEAATKKKFKLLCDKKTMEESLVNMGLATYEDIEVPATKDKIKVNKRRVIVPEVEEKI